MVLTTVILIALLLDLWLGEPARAHPLVGFGNLTQWLEKRWNRPSSSALQRKALGVIAVAALLGGFGLAASFIINTPIFGLFFEIILLYLCLGARSLSEHAEAIAAPLQQGDLEQARTRTSYMVSRDTSQMEAPEMSKSAVESVLENGNDALFATLFWYCIGGLPAALIHRLSNTLDAMWGYRTERFNHFGWAAARLDDVLAWIPARLCAITYALLGKTRNALRCWRTQAAAYPGPNGGAVMASGAGALEVQLGGEAIYHGKTKQRPVLGSGRQPETEDIRRAITMVQQGAWWWLGIIFLLEALLSGYL